jgi:hypothetical protein
LNPRNLIERQKIREIFQNQHQQIGSTFQIRGNIDIVSEETHLLLVPEETLHQRKSI